ncbi:hypothetical protein MVEN_00329500 [Mycena venus]|uniref:Uncharacterized protein n=1 Tax=Mycena venus TaxID=2733690 RepID=A0A8H7DA83_9AGAR|nr:hypothetical protein MVEN_00329500 [Mycena venus]
MRRACAMRRHGLRDAPNVLEFDPYFANNAYATRTLCCSVINFPAQQQGHSNCASATTHGGRVRHIELNRSTCKYLQDYLCILCPSLLTCLSTGLLTSTQKVNFISAVKARFEVVTEAYLYRPETLDKVTHWIKKIEDLMADKKIPVSGQLELFIKIEDEDCAYYFVDHASRAESWLEGIDTDDLGLPPVVSLSQLNILCEELYWSHVEHFPMYTGLDRNAVDSLVCVFTHAICDQMTSQVSTFPYSQKECEAFVSLLRNSRDHLSDGNIVCTVGKNNSAVFITAKLTHHPLSPTMELNLYLTYYGQECSRLSRDQAVLYDSETKNQWVSTVASRISFKTADRYLAQLNDVFVDHLVYSEQWKSMVTGCLQDWRGASQGAFLGLMLHLFFVALTPSLSLAAASASLFVASFFGSTVLIHRYAPLQGICAAEAMDYLEAIQSPTFKFQFVALAFALPHALNLWGTLVLFVNCIFMLATCFGTDFAAGMSVVAILAFLLFQWTTSERFNMSLTSIHDKFRAKFSRNQDDLYTSEV